MQKRTSKARGEAELRLEGGGEIEGGEPLSLKAQLLGIVGGSPDRAAQASSIWQRATIGSEPDSCIATICSGA